MGYSRAVGTEEGAVLIFAHTSKEARKISASTLMDMMVSDYCDVAVKLLEKDDFLYDQGNKDFLTKNIPHVIDSPIVCKECQLWGYELNEVALCEDCQDKIDESWEEYEEISNEAIKELNNKSNE